MCVFVYLNVWKDAFCWIICVVICMFVGKSVLSDSFFWMIYLAFRLCNCVSVCVPGCA
jgi:hypothetical protein